MYAPNAYALRIANWIGLDLAEGVHACRTRTSYQRHASDIDRNNKTIKM